MDVQTITAADLDRIQKMQEMQAEGSGTAGMDARRDIQDVKVGMGLTDMDARRDMRDANMDMGLVDMGACKDIRDVKVDTALPKKERMLDFIRQIGNPYCYRHGDYVVKVSFADTDVTLEDRMLSYVRAKADV